MLNESSHKPDKIWVDKEFFNRSMKSRLQHNNIEMCSTHNKGKYIIAEKNKTHKYTTSI